MQNRFHTIGLTAVMLAISGTSHAVDRLVPGTYPTIQNAILNASDGDHVIVSPGIYAEAINFLGKAITVRGIVGSEEGTIIKSPSGSIVTFNSGEDIDSILEGFTIAGGVALQGGGIYIDDTRPFIRRCRILQNHATQAGGAVFVDGGDPTFLNCVIGENTSDLLTAGIFITGVSTVTVVNSTLSDNDSPAASAIDVGFNSFLNMQNSIVYGNTLPDLNITGSVDIRYSNLQSFIAGSGNISDPPSFVSFLGGNFRLAPGSSGIDAGENFAIGSTTTDLEGTPRVINDPDTPDTGAGIDFVVDMGAYEFVPPYRYVNHTAPNGGEGKTWGTAYNDLQDALAESDVEHIWVATGTYRPDRGTGDRTMSFELNEGQTLRGGFAGTEASIEDRVPNSNGAILGGSIGAAGTADNSYNVVHGANLTSGTLIDIIIRRGNANGVGFQSVGGGLLLQNCDIMVENVVFRLNKAQSSGGAIYMLGGSPILYRCLIANNDGFAPPVHAFGSSVRMLSCQVTGNVFGLSVGSVLLTDNTSATIVNCTVWGNDAGGATAGIKVAGNTTAKIYNSLLWGNTGVSGTVEQNQINANADSTLVLADTTIEGNMVLVGPGVNGVDPMFVDADGPDNIPGTFDDNLRLSPGSPVIDSGANFELPVYATLDVAGLERFLDDSGTPDSGGGTAPFVDRGAYEFAGTTPSLCPTDIDGDGSTGFGDLITLLAAWGPCPGCPADIDGDGTAGFSDLLMILAAWGSCP